MQVPLSGPHAAGHICPTISPYQRRLMCHLQSGTAGSSCPGDSGSEGEGVLLQPCLKGLVWGGGGCVCVLPTAPRLLTVAAQGWSEQDGLGRAGALQRFRITPFLLDPFKMMNPQPDPHLHVPRGNWLLFPPPPALPPPAQRMGWLPSPLASAPIRGLFSPPTPPFRLTTGPQHQLLVAQHQPFSKQQVQAGRPQAPLQ